MSKMDAYPLFERIDGMAMLSPDQYFIAGAARGPKTRNKRRVVQGRDTWAPHHGGRYITDQYAAWMVWGDPLDNNWFVLGWFEGDSHNLITTPKSIRLWLRSELEMLHSFGELTEAVEVPVDIFDAVVQVELALEFVSREIRHSRKKLPSRH